MRAPRHSWTKEDIKKLIKLWDDKTPEQLADDIGVTRLQVMYMARLIRREGYALQKKRVRSQISSLIKDVIRELK